MDNNEDEEEDPNDASNEEQSVRVRPPVFNTPEDMRVKMLMTPEKFVGTPSKARVWMEDFRYSCNVNEWYDLIACKRFPAYLIGSARNWYTSEIADTEAVTDFDKLEEKFFEQYVPRSEKRDINRELDERKQRPDEAVSNFICDINKLCSDYRPTMSQEDRIDKILDKLLPSFFPNILEDEPATVQELRNKAVLIEEGIKRRGNNSVTAFVPRGNDRRREWQEVKKPFICFNCGGQGHSARQCPSERSTNNQLIKDNVGNINKVYQKPNNSMRLNNTYYNSHYRNNNMNSAYNNSYNRYKSANDNPYNKYNSTNNNSYNRYNNSNMANNRYNNANNAPQRRDSNANQNIYTRNNRNQNDNDNQNVYDKYKQRFVNNAQTSGEPKAETQQKRPAINSIQPILPTSVRVIINNIEIRGMADSGAAISVIDAELARQLDLKKSDEVAPMFNSAGPSLVDITGVSNVEIGLILGKQRRNTEHTIVIANHIPASFILGRTYLPN